MCICRSSFVAVLLLAATASCSRSQLRIGGESGDRDASVDAANDANTGGGGTGGAGAAGGDGGGGQAGGGGLAVPFCGRTDPEPPDDPPLEHMSWGMAARWSGTATTPSGWYPPQYPVQAEFRADGSYSASCPGPGCVAFYYGTDDDSQAKQWELITIMQNGEGWGEIRIVFDQGTVQTGELRHVVVSDDSTQLDFEFFATWGGDYGPVVFELECRLP